MSTTIYVGNLAWSVDDASLLELCQNYNCQSAHVVMGRNGRSRGTERASCSNTRRGNHTAYSNRMLCDSIASRSDALFA